MTDSTQQAPAAAGQGVERKRRTFECGDCGWQNSWTAAEAIRRHHSCFGCGKVDTMRLATPARP